MNGHAALELYDVNIASPQNPEFIHLLNHVPVRGGTDIKIKDVAINDVVVSNLFLYFANDVIGRESDHYGND